MYWTPQRLGQIEEMSGTQTRETWLNIDQESDKGDMVEMPRSTTVNNAAMKNDGNNPSFWDFGIFECFCILSFIKIKEFRYVTIKKMTLGGHTSRLSI